MSFASPAYLLALLAVPLVAVAHLLARRRARRYAVRYPALATLAPLVPASSAWRRRMPLALFLIALAVMGLALARPQATVAVPEEQASIVLVTDVSRSMLADDVSPSRLEAARAAALRFLDEVPERARVGLVAFSQQPHTSEPPSDDRDELRAILESLNADGGTATGDALAAALRLVGGRVGERPPAAIVLLSDGEATTGIDPLPIARRARRLGVPIHTVALGTRTAIIQTPSGALLPVPPDPETMRQIAELSGGRAFRVDDAEELAGVYKGLGSRVATKEQKREITVGFAAGGALLLLAALALGLRTTARLP